MLSAPPGGALRDHWSRRGACTGKPELTLAHTRSEINGFTDTKLGGLLWNGSSGLRVELG